MNDFIPIVAQDYQTKKVRMVGVWNKESIAMSDQTGKLTFWSRTKWRLWIKGETSGDFLEIQSAQRIVCPWPNESFQASIIYQVRQIIGETGMTCHKGTPTCFGWDEYSIENRLILWQLDYFKMGGKVLVLTQFSPTNTVLWVRILEETDVKYIVWNLAERSNWQAKMLLDCDQDTLLIRSPGDVYSTTNS